MPKVPRDSQRDEDDGEEGQVMAAAHRDGRSLSGGNTGTESGFYRGTCPDPECSLEILFPRSLPAVVCSGCGKRHRPSALKDLKAVKGDTDSVLSAVRFTILNAIKPKRGPDNIKVLGQSNYTCKLLSPILSYNGMDNHTGKAVPLPKLGKGNIFNCAVLCDKAFQIDPEHLNVEGFGRDMTGSHEYLQDLLNVVHAENNGEERLLPVHADGDGHCLVHAISRALVGRELFWHPLRLNLYENFTQNLDRYKTLLQGFVEEDEWNTMINECLPTFQAPEGEQVGLRNIHILVLANVLKRPIILLDSVNQMINVGDYSGVFLPILWSPDECRNKDGMLNPPLCIAWSSNAHNHFIPLVGIRGKPCPVLHRSMLQWSWGVDNVHLDHYIDFVNGHCTIGGTKMLHDSYIQRLASAMEELFYQEHGVMPQLVADVYQYIYKTKGIIGLAPEKVVRETRYLVQRRLLLVCLSCDTIAEAPVKPHWLEKGGDESLYDLVLKELGKIEPNKDYSFRQLDFKFQCRYDPSIDKLVPNCWQITCPVCGSGDSMRHVRGDGSVVYIEGDQSKEPDTKGKFFYRDKFYDSKPQIIDVAMSFGGKTVKDKVLFFQGQSDLALNSNAFQEAGRLVQKHFPGIFGIERLQSTVANYIIQQTAQNGEDSHAGDSTDVSKGGRSAPTSEPGISSWNAEEATKIILSGFQKQSVHKEELDKSEAERNVKRAIEAHAPLHQAKRSAAEMTPKTCTGSAASSPARGTPKTAALASHNKTPSRPPSASSPPSEIPMASSQAAPSPPSANRKTIRIVLQSGAPSETLTLTGDITIAELQQLVLEKTGVSAVDQKLRKGGIPPVMIDLSDPFTIAPLSHGDQIIVTKVDKETVSKVDTTSKEDPRHAELFNWILRGFNEHYPSDAIDTHQSGGDTLDSSILTLALLAERSGKDVWSYIQYHPSHFSVSGLFYLKAKRDLGLQPGKHLTFPSIPGKVFAYNDKLDRLELCMKELGHFEIEPDMEAKISERSQSQSWHGHSNQDHELHGSDHRRSTNSIAEANSPRGAAAFGTSGAIVRDHAPHRVFMGQGHTLSGGPIHMLNGNSASSASGGQGHILFGGHGHTLREQDIKMPEEDVSLQDSIHLASQKLVDLCDPASGFKQQSIEEEPEGMEEAEGERETLQAESHSLPQFTRVGPGFTVLASQPASISDTSRDLLRSFNTLAQNMTILETSEEPQKTDSTEEERAMDTS